MQGKEAYVEVLHLQVDPERTAFDGQLTGSAETQRTCPI